MLRTNSKRAISGFRTGKRDLSPGLDEATHKNSEQGLRERLEGPSRSAQPAAHKPEEGLRRKRRGARGALGSGQDEASACEVQENRAGNTGVKVFPDVINPGPHPDFRQQGTTDGKAARTGVAVFGLCRRQSDPSRSALPGTRWVPRG